MRSFLIQLKNGQKVIIEAEDEEILMSKVKSGNHKIVPIRGRDVTVVREANIESITELFENG